MGTGSLRVWTGMKVGEGSALAVGTPGHGGR